MPAGRLRPATRQNRFSNGAPRHARVGRAHRIMSLINDALRRASQAEKDRPRQAPTPMGMEPAPTARSSRLSVLVVVAVLITLLLAALFFWQWWNVRSYMRDAVIAANIAQTTTPHIVPPTV